MRAYPVLNHQSRPRFSLGAEELIELGQASVPRAAIAPPPGGASISRPVTISKAEGQLLVKVVENIVTFSQNYAIEFNSYCPPDRWQTALQEAGTWTQEIERQIASGASEVTIPAEAVMRLVDLEKCISAARDARLDSAKLAFTFSAVGAIANVFLGIGWLSVPAYLAGLAVLFGRPIMAKLSPTPQDPYKSELGRRKHICRTNSMGAGCAAPKETAEEAAQPKFLERVIVNPAPRIQQHHWGKIVVSMRGPEKATCLRQGRFLVRVEGWAGDQILPNPDWEIVDSCDTALNIAGVWQDEQTPRETEFGSLPQKSRHEATYFVEYAGPLTGGRRRFAGPFGCPFDTADYAKDDGGIQAPGQDGGYILYDEDWNVLEEGM